MSNKEKYKSLIEQKILTEFSGNGVIYSWTCLEKGNHTIPADFELDGTVNQIYLALIRLDEGPLVTAQLIDIEENNPPQIDQPVEAVFRLKSVSDERSLRVYGIKFRPKTLTPPSSLQ